MTPLNDSLFDVQLTGGVQPGKNREQVFQALALLLRVDRAGVERLLEGAPVAVREGVPYPEAVRLHSEILRTGAFCRVARSVAEDAANRLPCPRCGLLELRGQVSCSACGVYFHKLTPGRDASSAAKRLSRLRFAQRNQPSMPDDARRALLIGLLAASVTLAIPILTFSLGYLAILVHEMGHAITAWVFGYPSIPAFDFMHGGGVTHSYDRATFLLLLIYASWIGFLGWMWRAGNRRGLGWAAMGVLIYTLLAFSPVHEVLILFMGHGAELIFAAVFFYRALAGVALRTPQERPVYAFAGFFLQFRAIGFAYSLITDNAALQEYMRGKAGVENDFVRIAYHHLGTEVTSVAVVFFLCALLPPLAAWWYWRRRTSSPGVHQDSADQAA